MWKMEKRMSLKKPGFSSPTFCTRHGRRIKPSTVLALSLDMTPHCRRTRLFSHCTIFRCGGKRYVYRGNRRTRHMFHAAIFEPGQRGQKMPAVRVRFGVILLPFAWDEKEHRVPRNYWIKYGTCPSIRQEEFAVDSASYDSYDGTMEDLDVFVA